MAQERVVRLVDDLDGSDASETITFGYQGVTFEIDLNETHAKALDEAMQEWTEFARRVGGRKTRSTGSGAGGKAGRAQENQVVREWARANGHQVKERGRIPAEIVEAYRAAS